ncbi:hypothetical protein MNB_SV-9-36 [hydrothermal vent metagenome]|uniref:Nitrous oxide reductase maturation protein, outer-membrane lipoprotein NosL n=1 Tax=hydrothermal vent metagenome TaxID=652676 RepID=A0A1W1BNK7_9ZZZZ
MKKVLLLILVMSGLSTVVNAQMKCGEGKCGSAMSGGEKPKMMKDRFQSVSVDKAIILQNGDAKLSCPSCGMNLPKFYKTNHSAKVDGKVKQYCSIHCLVGDMNRGLKVEDIKVVDVKSLKFINAKDAFYVVGSSKKGTMSKVSKYAFALEKDAKEFAKNSGGKVMNFDEAVKKAQDDFKK